MSKVHELAEALAKAEQYMRGLGQMNAYGRTPEEDLAANARYRLAQDAWMKTRAEYETAIANLSAAELSKLAQQ